MSTYLIAGLAVAGMAALWVGVQVAWKKSFPDAFCDPDALAGRMGCGGGCKSHSTSCQSKETNQAQAHWDEEEKS